MDYNGSMGDGNNINNGDYIDAPCPRLCHLIKWPDFNGYGFNLHAEKTKQGQYIGKVDDDSPAMLAGLREGDKIIEVNFVNICNENHRQVVERIKSITNETRLLVIDDYGDRWYRERKLIIKSTQSNVICYRTPIPRPLQQGILPLPLSSSDPMIQIRQPLINQQQQQAVKNELNRRKSSSASSSTTSSTTTSSSKQDNNTGLNNNNNNPQQQQQNNNNNDDNDIQNNGNNSIKTTTTTTSNNNNSNNNGKIDNNNRTASITSSIDSSASASSSSLSLSSSTSSSKNNNNNNRNNINGSPISNNSESNLNNNNNEIDEKKLQSNGTTTKRIVSNDNNGGGNVSSGNGGNSTELNLNMTAAEMRQLIAQRKKQDIKKTQIDLKKKYEIIQQM